MSPNKLRCIIDEFNRYRSPECRARTLYKSDDKIIIEFSGTSIRSCCFDEHFEDFRLLIGDDMRLESVRDEGYRFVVCYRRESHG